MVGIGYLLVATPETVLQKLAKSASIPAISYGSVKTKEEGSRVIMNI